MIGGLPPIDAGSVLALRARILDRNAALSAKTEIATPATSGARGGFDTAIAAALDAVNATQAQAGTASTAFERGDTVDIASVMLARQKASISFEATLQVRNKLLSAYRDVMSMPV